MEECVLRPAEPADLASVAAIYNQGIGERRVVGFARVGPYSHREAYAALREHAVYVDPAARGRRIGLTLLEELCAAAERAGFYKLTGRVFTTNAASLAVHRAAGFEAVGVQRSHGWLDGEWKDCVLVERLLGEARISSSP